MRNIGNIKSIKKGKVLLISNSFPPVNDSHTRRVEYIVKCLDKFGWDVDVLTLNPPKNLPYVDFCSVNNVPPNISIFRSYAGIISDMYYMFKPKTKDFPICNTKHIQNKISLKNVQIFISKLINVPLLFDWYPFATINGIKITKKYNYNVIISSGSPVNHLVAYSINKIRDLYWVADFGDPWVFEPTYKDQSSKIKFLIDLWLEKCILKSVNKLCVTTEETKQNYLKNYSFIDDNKILVIPMGVDYNFFNTIRPEYSEKFRILYTGTISSIRNVIPFLESLKLIKKNLELRKNIEVLFVGSIGNEYKEIIRNENLEDIISFGGFVSYERSLSLMKGANLLISFGNKGGLQIPGKLFDYVASKTPFLWIKEQENDPALPYIKNLNRCIIVDNICEDLYSTITMVYNLYNSHYIESTFDLETLIPEFSWDKRIENLDTLLSEFIK